MKKMTTITPRQSNHHSYILPPELNGTTEKRLYMNVAQWALQQQKAICSHSVSVTFGISARQATNILSIIHHRYASVIQSTIKTVTDEGVTKNYIIITGITPKPRKRCASRIVKADDDCNLKKWKSAFLAGSRNKELPAAHPTNLCSTTSASILPVHYKMKKYT